MTGSGIAEVIEARALIGIPGGFVEGVAECLPTDGCEWGYVLSERELRELRDERDGWRELAETNAAEVKAWRARKLDPPDPGEKAEFPENFE